MVKRFDKNGRTSQRSTMKDKQTFANLSDFLQQLQTTPTIPPVHLWQPEYCGEMDLVIKANGEWWHEGRPILRQRMIDLFSRVLWKEGEDYYLKTPVEKIKIEVEDVPLSITCVDQIEQQGQSYIRMQTANQDVFILNEQHPLSLREFKGEIRPYVRVRYDLEALIQRQAFYHLVDLGELFEQEGKTILKLSSGSTFMELIVA
ncbi:hypothetical protein BJI46_05230 [Acinetobacter qingfengensis]|uniref:DUF1285 domain-containing protein n=2 Tax=Acinetobacter qingfengensis TaxID=1262585 RepID=A0A1E7R1H6_9GAMM|nr:hypothetical protein BJI46_05230 [Acinetobacter qingfengensis]